MSEMIERVACALFTAGHPDAEWSACRARFKWLTLARTAIQAMRDPTQAMLDATGELGVPDRVYREYWQSMINAALDEKGGGE